MVGRHHRINGHEFEPTPGDSEGQGSVVCYSPWGRKEMDKTERLNRTECVKSKVLRNSVLKHQVIQASDGSDGKESDCNARDGDLIPGSGRPPG